MPTYLPLFTESRITRNAVKKLETILNKKPIINNEENHVLIEYGDGLGWMNSQVFAKFVQKNKILFFMTTNNRIFKLLDLLMTKEDFAVIHIDYSLLSSEDVEYMLDEDDGDILWEDVKSLIENSGEFREVTLRNDKLILTIKNNGLIFFSNLSGSTEKVMQVINTLVVNHA